jgi:hypothetical protein
MRSHSTHVRDSSLRRLSLINRWLIAGSVTLTGVLTDVAAHAFPAKSGAQAATKSSKSRSDHRAKKSHSSTSTGSLSPPAEAPKAAPESAPAEEAAPEPAPEPEAAPEPAPEAESAPVEEAAAPVVSGGS